MRLSSPQWQPAVLLLLISRSNLANLLLARNSRPEALNVLFWNRNAERRLVCRKPVCGQLGALPTSAVARQGQSGTWTSS
jgi:hypothetical protein